MPRSIISFIPLTVRDGRIISTDDICNTGVRIDRWRHLFCITQQGRKLRIVVISQLKHAIYVTMETKRVLVLRVTNWQSSSTCQLITRLKQAVNIACMYQRTPFILCWLSQLLEVYYSFIHTAWSWRGIHYNDLWHGTMNICAINIQLFTGIDIWILADFEQILLDMFTLRSKRYRWRRIIA